MNESEMTIPIYPSPAVLDAALQYAARGWPVFPVYGIRAGVCLCGTSACSHPGKHPAATTGHNSATTDQARLRDYFGAQPDAKIAIRTGHASGIVVLDTIPQRRRRNAADS